MLYNTDLEIYNPLLTYNSDGTKEYFNWQYFTKLAVCGISYMTRRKMAIPIINSNMVCLPNNAETTNSTTRIEKLTFDNLRTNVNSVREQIHPTEVYIEDPENLLINHRIEFSGARFCSSKSQELKIKGFIVLIKAINPNDGWVVMHIETFNEPKILKYDKVINLQFKVK